MNKKNWKIWLGWLISPIAIGIYVTLLTIKLTDGFYERVFNPHEGDSSKDLSAVLMIAHQKSIDFRLQVRGERKVSPNLALLTVDERAVATIGRWPWPRDVMAKAVDRAVGYGAKVLAFDVVFSEPSINPASEITNKARKSGQLTSEVEKTLGAFAEQYDYDRALGQIFTKHANHIVAGSFAESADVARWRPESEFCRDLIFKRSPQAKQWDKEEILVSVNDPFTPYIPQSMVEVFQTLLNEVEAAKRDEFGEVKDRNDQVKLDSIVHEALHSTCDNILQEFSSQFASQWSEAILSQENPKEFTFPTYDDWYQDFRSKSFANAVIFADNWMLNTPTISEGTKHTAFFNAELDPDGTIRSKSLIMRTGSTYFPSLSLKAFLVANNFNASPVLKLNPATGFKEVTQLDITNNETGDVEFSVPTDAQGRLLINYAGPSHMFPYLSFADLMSDDPNAEITQRVWDAKTKTWGEQTKTVKKTEFMKDKIFIVGATAIGIFDLRVTPFEENYPGAETHLNALDNIVQRKFFRIVPDERIYMPLVLAVIGLSLTIALNFLGAVWGLLLTLGYLFGTALFDQHYLFKQGIVVTIIWPLFLISSIYVVLTFYRYLTEERGKKELRQTFQKYVSPAIVEEILSDPKNIELGGKKVHLTVFFSDVRGFTTISEKLDPRSLSDLLNSYLTPMTEIVFKNRGTLDKYMGDAIMAFFGAPIHYQDHAKYACRCALQSLDKLFELQKEYERKGLPSIDIGIGLNTGDVSVGNMGSETVRSYTVMGDAVNLASRLEGINKQYGTRIILSEMTYREVKDDFVCREVDWVRVKGKVEPVKIYELLAEQKIKDPKMLEMLKFFKEGYEHYHAKAWQEGLTSFTKGLDIYPNDEVSKLYVERCQDYVNEPPEEGWDGVFVMKTK